MGMTEIIADLAVRAVRVLIVEVPGRWLTRVELEQQMIQRGWRHAWAPAEADVLAVCGVPGPELTSIVDRLWEQMPGPRVRADMTSSNSVSSALDDAATMYVDTAIHRRDARERAQEPQIPHDSMGHGGHDDMEQGNHGEPDHGDHDSMDHGSHNEMDHSGHEDMNHGDHDRSGHGGTDQGSHGDHGDHGDMDHGSHGGPDHGDHDSMDHGSHDHSGHGGMDHGSHAGMDMAPGGISLAHGGQDRDGLEMDVLHLPLGPVLPYWSAGLVLNCSLQGDVVFDAEVSIVDGREHEPKSLASSPGLRPAMYCDDVLALLALAGADDLAARARLARDCLLRGDQTAARDVLERMVRAVRRSWLLRWSLRGVLVLDPSDLERHGLPASCEGDAYDRMLLTLTRVRDEVGGAGPTSEDDDRVSWRSLPHLVTGLELATLRLAVASLNLHCASQAVEYDR